MVYREEAAGDARRDAGTAEDSGGIRIDTGEKPAGRELR